MSKVNIVALVILSACATQAPPTPVLPDTHQPSVHDVRNDCQSHFQQVNAGCAVQAIDKHLSLLVAFADIEMLRANSSYIDTYLTPQYCAAADRSDMAGRVYVTVPDVGFLFYHCPASKWSDWISLGPRDIPANLTIGDVCSYIGQDPVEPVKCNIARANGMWRLHLDFVREEAASQKLINQLQNQLATPFCNAASRLGDGAIIEFHKVRQEMAMNYNCETRRLGKPYPLKGPSPQAQSPSSNQSSPSSPSTSQTL